LTKPLDAARQGDVLLIRRETMPAAGLVPVEPEDGRLILARGEATGHHHSLAGRPSAALFRPDDLPSGGVLWLRLDEPDALLHQEHAPIPERPGIIEVRRQIEAGDGDEPVVVQD
jgi:hypothetical protein